MAKVVIDMDIQFGTCKTLGGGGGESLTLRSHVSSKIKYLK